MSIKSYVGARADTPKEEHQILVKDIMTTNLILFRPDQNVHDAMELLIKNKISGGPVVDSDGKLVGMISEGDCIKEISHCKYYNIPMATHKLEDFMVKDVHTMKPNTDIFELGNQFYKQKIRRFPVVDQGKLVGQVSQFDVLKAILNSKHQRW